MYERADWQLFIRPETLPQKAGCNPYQIGRVALKELIDNALDNGAEVTLTGEPGFYRIADTGTGIEPSEIPRLFAVNRPLLSSKLKRLPLRGMLGNGLRVVMGAVAAYGGSIAVTSRGHRLTLAVDTITGSTRVVSDEPVPLAPGTVVEIGLRLFSGAEREPADLAIAFARMGNVYCGASRPAWYSARDLQELFARVTPATTTVGAVIRDVFRLEHDDRRPAKALDHHEIETLHGRLRAACADDDADIGYIGELGGPEHYAWSTQITSIGDAKIPYCIEAWVECRRADNDEEVSGEVRLLVNRSPAIEKLTYYADSSGLTVDGCGIGTRIASAKRAIYMITLSLIAPHVRLMNDGKTPYDAAWLEMESAYLAASDNEDHERLPANARQIMYAARPGILERTGAEKLNDSYFTQTLLPDYIAANPEQCANWDVVFDARGHFNEPHTRRSIPIGTLAVREYLGDRPQPGPAVALNRHDLYPTSGPPNRYRNVCFIEKQGFDALLQQAQIAERFDLAIMSTKGMSVVAARMLLDRLAPLIDRIFVLHDFDVAGFSIFGTLGGNGRRYSFENTVNIIDLGLRLTDVEAMGLAAEPVVVKDFDARRDTLITHGATADEIEFLRQERVALNAMTSRQFVDFIERKLVEHGVEKVVPADDVIEAHACRLLEQHLGEKALAEIRDEITRKARSVRLPGDLALQVQELLRAEPSLPWDAALAIIVEQLDDGPGR